MLADSATQVRIPFSRRHPAQAFALGLLCVCASQGAAQGGAWSAPQLLHTGNPQEVIEVDAAIDDVARIQVVHGRYTTSPATRTVWASQWTGTAWSAPERLSPAELALNPAVALDPITGQGYATWGIYDNELFNTTMAESRFDGSQWLPQPTPAWGATGASYEGYNILAADRMGRTFALYQKFVGGRARAAGAVRTAGGWSAGTLLSNAAGGEHSIQPSLAVNAAGLAAAAWIDSDESEGRLYVALGTAAGWGAPQRMAFDINARAHLPRVAVGDNGQAFLVWFEYVGGLVERSFYSHHDGSQWSPPARLDHLDAMALHPDVAVGAGGDAWAIYTQETTTPGAIGLWARRWNGSGWAPPVMVNTSSLGLLIAGQRVAVDQAGRVLVVYYAFNNFGTFKTLYYSYWNGSQWEDALVDAGASGHNRLHRIAMNRSGHALAVWDNAGSTSPTALHDLRVARFTPPPPGPMFANGFEGP